MNTASLRVKTSTLIILFAMSPLVLAVLLGLKSFEVWEQITYMWYSRASPIVELAKIHPHALRYALIYPILALSDYLDLKHDLLFSFTLLIFCFFTIRNIQTVSTIIEKDQKPSNLFQFFSAYFLVIMFFQMNGRIGFAFLGYSILLLIVVQHHYERKLSIGSFIGALLGLALCSVSSGTLVSGTLCIVIAIYFEVCRCIKRTTLTRPAFAIFVASVILSGLLFRYLLVGVSKNVTFYGGGSDGFLRMLEHGIGRALYPALNAAGLPPVLVCWLLITVLIGIILSRLRNSILLHMFLGTIVCGLFGYSALTLSLIPLLVLLNSTFTLSISSSHNTEKASL